MPCWNRTTISVGIAAADQDLLMDAMKGLGYATHRNGTSIVGRQANDTVQVFAGQIAVPAGQEYRVNQIKRAYSEKAIAKVGKRFGWVTRRTGRDTVSIRRS